MIKALRKTYFFFGFWFYGSMRRSVFCDALTIL